MSAVWANAEPAHLGSLASRPIALAWVNAAGANLLVADETKVQLWSVSASGGRPQATFKLPRPIDLDTVAPTARLVSYRPRVLHPGEKVRVVYRVSEPAHGVLFVNGKQVIVTYSKSRTARLQWSPRRARRYGLQIAGVDLAGNLGPRSPVFIVRVRASA